MTEIRETDLCIVCNKPGPRFYVQKGGKLKYSSTSFLSTRKSTRLNDKVEGVVDQAPEDELDALLLPQLRVMFLLKQIFQCSLHDESTAETMRMLGNPSEWFEICQRCTKIVDEGVEVARKLKFYEEEYKRIVSALKRNYTLSITDDIAFGKYVVVRDETEEDSKFLLNFRNTVRGDDVNVKDEPLAQDLPYHDDWIACDDNFESQAFDNEIQRDRDEFDLMRCKARKATNKISSKTLDGVTKVGSTETDPLSMEEEIPSSNHVEKIKQIWSKYKKDPDFVYWNEKEVNSDIKPRKSARRKAPIQRVYMTEMEQEDPETFTDDEDEALLRQQEAEEQKSIEALKRNKSLLQKVVRTRSKQKYGFQKRRKNEYKRSELKKQKFSEPKEKKFIGRPQSVAVTSFIEKAYEYLDMTLISYPPETEADRAKIPTGGNSLNMREEGECALDSDFPCPSCKKCFANKYFTIAHIHRVHLGIEKPWKCNQCLHANTVSRRLRWHVEAHKLGTAMATLTCPICKKYLKRKKEATDTHIMLHEKKTDNPTCYVCKKSFIRFEAYVKHMKQEHDFQFKPKLKQTLVCEICSFTVTNPKRLDYHKIKEHNEVDETGTFPMCSECSEVFFDETYLEKHVVTFHGEGSGTSRYFCEQCGKGYFFEKHLKGHYAYCSDMPIACQICGQECKNKRKLQKHIGSRHPETIDMSVDEIADFVKRKNEENPFKCTLCPQTFPFSNLLFWHHRKDHPEVTDKFKCSECGKGFSRQCSVKRHYDKVHLQSKHKCEVCGKEYLGKSALLQHQRNVCKMSKNRDPAIVIVKSNTELGQNSVTLKQPQQILSYPESTDLASYTGNSVAGLQQLIGELKSENF